MAAAVPDFSEEFAVTAREEAERLRVRAHELRARGDRWVHRGQEALGEAERLEARVRELDELLGRAPQLRVDLQTPALQGQHLREAAVRILVEHRGTRRPIHYREWYDLLTESGFAAAGKDPLATFLTQITRSPLVERVDGGSGVYQIDPNAAYERARAELAVTTRQLTEAEEQLNERASASDASDPDAQLQVVRAASARLAQAQRNLEAVIAARSVLLHERLAAA
jgi:hypothetical protein